jgi:hypothetical protein
LNVNQQTRCSLDHRKLATSGALLEPAEMVMGACANESSFRV